MSNLGPSSSALSPFLGETAVKAMMHPRYYEREKMVECAIEEKVSEPDSFSVELLPKKEELFEVRGKSLSFEGEKTLHDVAGQTIFTMCADMTSSLYNMYLRDLRNKQVYTVRKRSMIPGMGRNVLEVLPGRNPEAAPVIEIVSDFSKSQAIVKHLAMESEVALIERAIMTAKKIITGLDSYQIKVYPGMDIALIVMLTVCFDEHYTEGLS